jgi:hypothetical protein
MVNWSGQEMSISKVWRNLEKLLNSEEILQEREDKRINGRW